MTAASGPTSGPGSGSESGSGCGSGSGPMLGRVAVLGLGLIGGSFAAAVRRARLADRVVGYAPPPDGAAAVGLGLVDEACTDVAAALRGADLVMLAAPVTVLPALFDEVAACLPDGAIVTDCASTKRSVLAAARASLGNRAGCFVAGHPIAGSERSGPQAARATLFDGAQVMVCPAAETDRRACERVQALWRALGANGVLTGGGRHHPLYGELSHRAHAVAFALSAAVGTGAHADDALRFAGGGLRDTTRIGASSPTLWADILLDNRDAVLESAQAFERELRAITGAIRDGHRDELVELLGRGADWRRRLT